MKKITAQVTLLCPTERVRHGKSKRVLRLRVLKCRLTWVDVELKYFCHKSEVKHSTSINQNMF